MKYLAFAAAFAMLPLAAQAQSPSGTTASPPASTAQNSSQETKENNLLTISKLKQDLTKAGFTDIQILADSFVVQAKDKNGNPTVMSLSPGGVFAISELQNNQDKQAKASTGQQTETRR
jgi:hypothetical protein